MGGKWFMMYQYYAFIINRFNILFSFYLHIVQIFVLYCMCRRDSVVHIFAYSFSDNVTGISRGTAFYVKLSKTEYTGYKFIGNITISD